MPDHREIVGDDHIRERELGLEPGHQIEDLALDGDIEAGSGLIGNDEIGPERQSARHAGPARLAAREFVRIAADKLLRQPDEGKKILRHLAARAHGDGVDDERLGDGRANGEPRA